MRSVADLQSEIGGDAAIGLQGIAGLLGPFESGMIDGDGIRPDREIFSDVKTPLVGGHCADGLSIGIGYDDFGAWDGSARRICYGARNTAEVGLCGKSSGENRQDKESKRKPAT